MLCLYPLGSGILEGWQGALAHRVARLPASPSLDSCPPFQHLGLLQLTENRVQASVSSDFLSHEHQTAMGSKMALPGHPDCRERAQAQAKAKPGHGAPAGWTLRGGEPMQQALSPPADLPSWPTQARPVIVDTDSHGDEKTGQTA